MQFLPSISVGVPCALFHRNGDWSDSSPLWTESIKQELNFVPDAEDGAFWMSFEDFVTHFACINVNRFAWLFSGEPLSSPFL